MAYDQIRKVELSFQGARTALEGAWIAALVARRALAGFATALPKDPTP